MRMVSLYVTAIILSSTQRVSHFADATAACGQPGRALFNTHGMPQGVYGELYSAVRCFVQGAQCNSVNLPDAARNSNSNDPSKLQAFYGFDIRQWCTQKVTDFSYAFNGTVRAGSLLRNYWS
jgi:hypothetical protein